VQQRSDRVQGSTHHKKNVPELRLQRVDLVHNSKRRLLGPEHGFSDVVIIPLDPTVEFAKAAEPELEHIALIGHGAEDELVVLGYR
jgi:hypothetical protein